MDPLKRFLPTRLVAARRHLGLSQQRLAREAAVAVSTVNAIESGLGDFRVSTLVKLCGVLGVSPGWLLGWESSGVRIERIEIWLPRELPAREEAVHLVGAGLSHSAEGVAVKIHRNRDLGMAEQLHDDLGVHPCRDQEAGTRVP